MNQQYLVDDKCAYKGEIYKNSNDLYYSCTLNQTDIGANSNKYYILQLVKIDRRSSFGSKYVVFAKYGRMGDAGKVNHKTYVEELAAIDCFNKQFMSKTKNNWPVIGKFKQNDGKYFLIE